MAGLVSYRHSDYDELYRVNVLGTESVMNACLKASVQRVIHLSSIAGMGIPKEGEIGDEDFIYNIGGRGLYYCDTKYEGELKVYEAAQKGLPVIVLSPGITFGEGDTHPHHHTIFNALARGGMIGYPQGGVMFSDIEDIVQACVNAMTMGGDSERYVIGCDNLTFKEAADIVARVIGSRPPVFPVPGFLSEAAGAICETIFPLFGKKPSLTWQVAWLSQRKIFFSCAKAKRELDFVPTPFEETIRRTAPYYLSHKSATSSQAHSLGAGSRS
jgi:dihydroflavonol-4-reductase